MIRTCKYCGEEFEAIRTQAYCNRDHYAICVICGKQFVYDPRTLKQCCSRKCSSELRKRTKEWKSKLTQPYEPETMGNKSDIENLQNSVKPINEIPINVDSTDLDSITTCTGVKVKNAYERIIYDYLVETGQNFMYNFPIEFEYEGNIQLTYISFNVDGRYIDVQADESLLEPIYKTVYLPFDMMVQCYKQHMVSVIVNKELLPLLQAEGIKSILMENIDLKSVQF